MKVNTTRRSQARCRRARPFPPPAIPAHVARWTRPSSVLMPAPAATCSNGRARIKISHPSARRRDGPGIPEQGRTKVFRRFYRLDASRSTPGNGLGLALVAAVADLHGAAMNSNRQSVSRTSRSPRRNGKCRRGQNGGFRSVVYLVGGRRFRYSPFYLIFVREESAVRIPAPPPRTGGARHSARSIGLCGSGSAIRRRCPLPPDRGSPDPWHDPP